MLYEKIKLPVAEGEVLLSCYCADLIPNVTDGIKRPSVVIAGGGAYRYVSARETEPVAMRLAAYGINAYTVIYRTAPEVRYPRPMQDVAAAMAWVRAHCAEHGGDPDRIAVMGFSAGGHAAASVGVSWQKPELWAPLGLTPEQVKPNAMVLGYPVITGGTYAHRGSFENLTGSGDLAVHDAYSLENQVTAFAPDTFLWTTWDDQAVPVENTLMMATALRRAGTSCEVHIYQHGSHGLSLCDETTGGTNGQMLNPAASEWFRQCVAFLKRMGAKNQSPEGESR